MNSPESRSESTRIKVYQSKTFSRALGEHLLSELYATRETIERARAIIIEDSAMEVDASDLDEHGRYIPKSRHSTQ